MTAMPPYSFTLPMSTPGRQLDPVRAAALQAAVAMVPMVLVQSSADRIDISVSPERVIANAIRFEQYLAGDDA